MADWLTHLHGWLGPDAGLWGLFAYSFLAATLLPGGSEIAFFAYLKAAPEQASLALALVTLGNTLGGLSSYAAGRFLPKWQRLEQLPHAEQVRRFGSPTLLLAWAPLIGDLLCVAAGWLRLNWVACTLFMAIGKGARYAVVAYGTLQT